MHEFRVFCRLVLSLLSRLSTAEEGAPARVLYLVHIDEGGQEEGLDDSITRGNKLLESFNVAHQRGIGIGGGFPEIRRLVVPLSGNGSLVDTMHEHVRRRRGARSYT